MSFHSLTLPAPCTFLNNIMVVHEETSRRNKVDLPLPDPARNYAYCPIVADTPVSYDAQARSHTVVRVRPLPESIRRVRPYAERICAPRETCHSRKPAPVFGLHRKGLPGLCRESGGGRLRTQDLPELAGYGQTGHSGISLGGMARERNRLRVQLRAPVGRLGRFPLVPGFSLRRGDGEVLSRVLQQDHLAAVPLFPYLRRVR